MPGSHFSTVLQHIRRLVGLRDGDEPPDAQLLQRFVRERDETAFDRLLRRHAPMVLGVCRRLLSDPDDVEDAFQATFLVLVRKAGSISRGELLANWLFGVAYRTARKARGNATRRRARLLHEVPDMPAPAPTAAPDWEQLRPMLDEEVHRLPDHYRRPVILCYFQSKTYDEAAAELGCSHGTVKGRLERARDLLRKRLARRGLVLPAGGLAALLEPSALSAAVPAALLEATRATALRFAADPVSGAVAPHLVALTEGVIQTMFLSKLKLVAVAATIVAVGVGIVTHLALAARNPGDTRAAVPVPPPQKEEPAEKGKTEPASAPLEARLVAKKTTYVLDPAMKQAVLDYKKKIEDKDKPGAPGLFLGGSLPACPTVDLALELRNRGDKEIKLWIGGDQTRLQLSLKGSGAVGFSYTGPVATIARLPQTIALAPGRVHTIPITSLSHGFRGLDRVYWIEPGEYTLTAGYVTAVSPPPAGSKEADEKFGRVTATSAPVKLRVEAK